MYVAIIGHRRCSEFAQSVAAETLDATRGNFRVISRLSSGISYYARGISAKVDYT